MTDYCKIKLIGKMISDVIEFTDWSKDNMDALVSCIQAVVEYDGGDYPPIPDDFSFDHLPGTGGKLDLTKYDIQISCTGDNAGNEDHPES